MNLLFKLIPKDKSYRPNRWQDQSLQWTWAVSGQGGSEPTAACHKQDEADLRAYSNTTSSVGL